MKKIFMLALLLGSAVANAGPYPIVTNLSIEREDSTTWTYHFTQTLVNSPAADAPFPYKYMCLGKKYKKMYGTDYLAMCKHMSPEGVTRAEPGDTWSTVAMRDYARHKSDTSFYNIGGPTTEDCVGYIGTTRSDLLWEEGNQGPLGCTHVPPINNSCTFMSPQITIDHGRTSISGISGSVKTADVPVQCLLPTTIKIELLPERLLMDGISAALSTAPSVEVGPTGAVLHIKSTLNLEGRPAAGLHESAGVVRLNYE